jgi:hypothetical protein
MHISNLKIVFVSILLCYYSEIRAQRLGIKPLIGIVNNGLSMYFDPNSQGGIFTQADQFEPRATTGFVISYKLTPILEIEAGLQWHPTTIKYDIYKNYTFVPENYIGRNQYTVRYDTYHLAFSKQLKELGTHSKLRTIVGISFFNVNSGMSSKVYYEADTMVKESGGGSALSLNGLRRISWGALVGIGDEICIKNHPVGEIRLLAKYNFTPIAGAYSIIQDNSITVRNEYRANRLSFEASLLINLSSLLGEKFSD